MIELQGEKCIKRIGSDLWTGDLQYMWIVFSKTNEWIFQADLSVSSQPTGNLPTDFTNFSDPIESQKYFNQFLP